MEKQHRGSRTHKDVLAKTVQTAWDRMNPSVLSKINERWKRVLHIVLADGGDNGNTDSFRGERFTEIFGELFVAEPENDQAPTNIGSEGEDDDDEDDNNDDNDDAWPEGGVSVHG